MYRKFSSQNHRTCISWKRRAAAPRRGTRLTHALCCCPGSNQRTAPRLAVCGETNQPCVQRGSASPPADHSASTTPPCNSHPSHTNTATTTTDNTHHVLLSSFPNPPCITTSRLIMGSTSLFSDAAASYSDFNISYTYIPTCPSFPVSLFPPQTWTPSNTFLNSMFLR